MKRVSPTDERKEFLLDRFRKQGAKDDSEGVRSWLTMGALFLEADGKTVTYKSMISTDAEDPRRPGVKAKPKRVKLSSVIGSCTGRHTPEVVYDEWAGRQDVIMDDDLVVRKGAHLEKLVPDLQRVIGECGLDGGGAPPVLTLKEEVHEVYVVGGKFAIKPREWRGKDEIDVYANEDIVDKSVNHVKPGPGQNDVNSLFYSPRPAEFVRTLGNFVDRRMVWDVELPAEPRFHAYMHQRWEGKATAEDWKADHDPEKVLANVSEQTGLTFKKEKRKVPVLYVSVAK